MTIYSKKKIETRYAKLNVFWCESAANLNYVFFSFCPPKLIRSPVTIIIYVRKYAPTKIVIFMHTNCYNGRNECFSVNESFIRCAFFFFVLLTIRSILRFVYVDSKSWLWRLPLSWSFLFLEMVFSLRANDNGAHMDMM